eukprot:scaffold227152_cov17-Prasinocladus_malaysianus.AAC.1
MCWLEEPRGWRLLVSLTCHTSPVSSACFMTFTSDYIANKSYKYVSIAAARTNRCTGNSTASLDSYSYKVDDAFLPVRTTELRPPTTELRVRPSSMILVLVL